MIARRSLLAAAAVAGAGLTPLAPVAAAASATTPIFRVPGRPVTPREALARLHEGNQRWVTGALLDRDPADQRRKRVEGGQHPYAVIFTCIDSRVPPEVLFDEDLGDLFVVRTAAQVLDPLIAGSIEYGPAHGVPLVLVLGHTRCGAIQATVEFIEDGAEPEGHLAAVVRALAPAYYRAAIPPGTSREKTIDLVARSQVIRDVAKLRRDPVLEPLIHQGKADVTGAMYNLGTGDVTRV